jgi:hypothetical protein
MSDPKKNIFELVNIKLHDTDEFANVTDIRMASIETYGSMEKKSIDVRIDAIIAQLRRKRKVQYKTRAAQTQLKKLYRTPIHVSPRSSRSPNSGLTYAEKKVLMEKYRHKGPKQSINYPHDFEFPRAMNVKKTINDIMEKQKENINGVITFYPDLTREQIDIYKSNIATALYEASEQEIMATWNDIMGPNVITVNSQGEYMDILENSIQLISNKLIDERLQESGVPKKIYEFGLTNARGLHKNKQTKKRPGRRHERKIPSNKRQTQERKKKKRKKKM